MATSKKTVTTVEETLDSTPEVMDFVESTPVEETPVVSGLVNLSEEASIPVMNNGSFTSTSTDNINISTDAIDPKYLQGYQR